MKKKLVSILIAFLLAPVAAYATWPQDIVSLVFGTGVQTALTFNTGSAGSFVVNGGALGTPSSGVATNLTGTASGLTAGNVTTNANLTGIITSVGNATSIASQPGTGTTIVVSSSPTITTLFTLGTSTMAGVASGAGVGTVRIKGATGDTSGLYLTDNNSTDGATILQTASAGTLGIGGGNTVGLSMTSTRITASLPTILASYTVGTLPTPATNMEANVSDGDAGLAWGATVVNSGAGATNYKVRYNGSAWTVVGK